MRQESIASAGGAAIATTVWDTSGRTPDPRYSVGAEGETARRRYAGARFPVHALSFDDDEMMTLSGIRSLVALYENAPRAVERVAPAELGIARIGHFGAFRREREADLWPRLAGRLGGLRRETAQ